MKHLLYGDCVILVADVVADVVLAHAASCARIGLVERVNVPTFDEAGLHATISVIVGPGAAIALFDAADDELGDDLSGVFGAPTRAFVAEIRRRTRRAAALRTAREIQEFHAGERSRRSTMTSWDDWKP